MDTATDILETVFSENEGLEFECRDSSFDEQRFCHPPLVFCKKGHISCEVCSPDLCALCGVNISAEGSVLDTFRESSYLPCKFSKYGCKFLGRGTYLSQHEEICEYTIASVFTTGMTNKCSFYRHVTTKAMRETYKLGHCSIAKSILKYDRWTFMVVVSIDHEEGELHFVGTNLGDIEDIEDFRLEIGFVRENGRVLRLRTSLVLSEAGDTDLPTNCFSIHPKKFRMDSHEIIEHTIKIQRLRTSY